MFDLKSFLAGKGRVMVTDAESVGLHGEAFAIGYTVITASGPVARWSGACPSHMAKGRKEDRVWVEQNIPKLKITHRSPRLLRDAFWLLWEKEMRMGAVMAADVPWPVEANLISACIADRPTTRTSEGPYPLFDIASFLWAKGINPLQTFSRLEGEKPVHDPAKDADQSARIFLEVLKGIVPK